MLGVFRKRAHREIIPLPDKPHLCENCRFFDSIDWKMQRLNQDKRVINRRLSASWCTKGDFQLLDSAACELFSPLYTVDECIAAREDWYPPHKRTEGAWAFIYAWEKHEEDAQNAADGGCDTCPTS